MLGACSWVFSFLFPGQGLVVGDSRVVIPPSEEQEPVLEPFNEKLQHLLFSQGTAGLLESYGSNTCGALYHNTPPHPPD